MKKLVKQLLKFFTKRIIKKYKPKIIGITGSVGKTSTKEAIYTVLSSKFRVRRNIKNYNNELGVPLTFIGMETGGKSLFKWIAVFKHALGLLLIRDKHYPEILVIEMGADRPGDIKYLVSFVPCDVSVITCIGDAHIEFFGSVEDIYKEKINIVRHLKKDGYAILNADDKLTSKANKETEANVITYGFSENATVTAIEMNISGVVYDEKTDVNNIRGLSFKLQHNGSTIPIMLPNVLGKQHVSSALAAAVVGIIFNMNLIEISESLSKYDPPNGRMNLIAGIKHTLIIDDSYNASPIAVKNALDIASSINLQEGQEKFVVLGDMLELGAMSEKAHEKIGQYVADLEFDHLFTVGEMSHKIAVSARAAGMLEDSIYSFSTSEEAGKFLQQRIEHGDLILIKGSQGMRMEKIVKEIMAEPLRAKELLVRQDDEWLKR